MRKKRCLKAVALTSAVILSATSIQNISVKANAKNYFSESMGGVKTEKEMEAMKQYESKNTNEEVFSRISTAKTGTDAKTTLKTMSATTQDDLPEAFCSENVPNRNVAKQTVKDQNPFGTCWAHATMASFEDSLISQGLKKRNGETFTRNNTDFSERHLAYFRYHQSIDPLNLTIGDSSCVYGRHYLQTGCLMQDAAFTLASWKGVVDESVAPYSTLVEAYFRDENEPYSKDYDLDESCAFHQEATLNSLKMVSFRDPDEIKRMIMKYGACSVEINFNTDYMTNRMRMCTPEQGSGHAVTIVGWNDNDSKDLYPNNPSKDGCWIIRNSWGVDWGENGYFYLSYDDPSVRPEYGHYVGFFIGQEANTYDNNYQYDGSGYYEIQRIPSSSRIANRFVVPQTSGGETLKAVSLAVSKENVKYNIQIYKNCSTTNPESGEPQFSVPQVDTLKYSGYYTIPLKETIDLKAGDVFSIVIKLTSDDNTAIDTYAEPEYAYYDYLGGELTLIGRNYMQRGQSFLKMGLNGKWQDQLDLENSFTPRIKAFTVNKPTIYIGDVNKDGEINQEDIQLMNSALNSYASGKATGNRWYKASFDLNHDGEINQSDRNSLQQIVNSQAKSKDKILLGDVNRDGILNNSDVAAMSNEISAYNSHKNDSSIYYLVEADYDQDGDIDTDDYNQLDKAVRNMPVNYLGDLNNDGVVDSKDKKEMSKALTIYNNGIFYGQFYYNAAADIDLDGDVDMADSYSLDSLIAQRTPTVKNIIYGDVNNDNRIDKQDQYRMISELNSYTTAKSQGINYYNVKADLNQDGLIDQHDYNLLLDKIYY